MLIGHFPNQRGKFSIAVLGSCWLLLLPLSRMPSPHRDILRNEKMEKRKEMGESLHSPWGSGESLPLSRVGRFLPAKVSSWYSLLPSTQCLLVGFKFGGEQTRRDQMKKKMVHLILWILFFFQSACCCLIFLICAFSVGIFSYIQCEKKDKVDLLHLTCS